MLIDRRELIGLAGALLPLSARASGSPDAGLHGLAGGRKFGSAVAWSEAGADRGSFANPRYDRLLRTDCNLLVAENEMKWQALRPAPDRFDFARADAIAGWAYRHGVAMRGHTLLWHQPKWMPAWEERFDFGTRPASRGAAMLTQHVETVCRRYPQIESWDVVNEAVAPDDGSLYATALSRAIGSAEETIDLAFRTARAAAPGAQLVYNDYMSWEPRNAGHRGGVLKLLEGFRRRGVPVDALGVQSHLVTQGADAAGAARTQARDWRDFLDAVTAMDYALVITELDVRDDHLPADPALRDRATADYVRAYLDVMLDYRQLGDILVWGMCDRYSWLDGFMPRRDGAKRRPCPYDADFQPKPMRAAIADALRSAAPRPA